ncbi:MAG: ABC transporter ATP-binding protein [Betaproteobacteria bacterium]|nr:ABC transporter ATP-binding protein [Betaproteobacteria bacterium]MBU6513437.1 ABC transporter ATP-binding protein [Betaproteobacteria bacterium]MDE2152152.1 ABC transporter ATP-binding protein [Betaproteobacteria bacterium]
MCPSRTIDRVEHATAAVEVAAVAAVEAAVEARGLTVRFGGHVAVREVSCTLPRGSLTAIVGPNGAGKTTFFNLLSGQVRPTAGSIHLYGQDVTALSAAQRAALGIGRAFQLTTLFPALSVLDNVRLALARQRQRSWRLLSIAADDAPGIEQARHWLERTRLLARAQEPAAQLSHGDQRKLEVAMLLAMRPRVFMFDEPTAGMSVDEVPVILELIQEIKDDPMNTVLLVEHKIQVVHSLADRILVLHNGELLAQGEPAEVMDSPLVREAYLGVAGARP